jgi:hypothetical protein
VAVPVVATQACSVGLSFSSLVSLFEDGTIDGVALSLLQRTHLGDHSVAAAPHPFDVAWRLRVIAESAAQQLHALNDRFGRDHEARPYSVAQLVEAEQVGGAAHQRHEQIERQGLQWDDRSRTPHPPRCEVDGQIIDLVPRGIGGGVRGIRTPLLGRHGGTPCWAVFRRSCRAMLHRSAPPPPSRRIAALVPLHPGEWALLAGMQGVQMGAHHPDPLG